MAEDPSNKAKTTAWQKKHSDRAIFELNTINFQRKHLFPVYALN